MRSRDIQANGLGCATSKTELTQALAAGADFTAWLAKRTPAGCWGEVHELGGAVVFSATAISSFVNGRIPHEVGTSQSTHRPRAGCREI